MKHRLHFIHLTVVMLILCLLFSSAAAVEEIPYTRGLRPTAAEMGFDLEAIYNDLPHFPLIWEGDTLIIENGDQYKNVFVSLMDWSTLKSECIDNQWRFNVKPEDVDKIKIVPYEGDSFDCYPTGLILPDWSYWIGDIRIYMEGGRTGYDSARWNVYMPDDSDALYNMVRFTPDGAMDLYTYTAAELLDVNGELFEVHLEYVTHRLTFSFFEENGEYLYDVKQEDASDLTRLWTTKPGDSSTTYYLYNSTEWDSDGAPAPLEGLSEHELMELYPPLPLDGEE